jgi:hypothetical protein
MSCSSESALRTSMAAPLQRAGASSSPGPSFSPYSPSSREEVLAEAQFPVMNVGGYSVFFVACTSFCPTKVRGPAK